MIPLRAEIIHEASDPFHLDCSDDDESENDVESLGAQLPAGILFY